jgi:hypothetical protein
MQGFGLNCKILSLDMQEERAAAEEQRRKEEDAEVRKYRKGLQFKAQPLPDFYGRHTELS